VNYTNREVVRRLKQYDMFLSSLELTNDDLQRERICDQLDKIEKQILLETNTEYEEEYMTLLSEEPKLFSEEKARLRNIISLIEDRKKYLEERKLKHKRITGSLVELTTFLGEDKLLDFKNRLRIIEKYEDNKVKQEKIIKEMKSLDIKISEASRNVKANTRLNESLENKMIKKIDNVLEELNLYSLVDQRSDITKKQESLKYALDMAKDNLKSARSLGDSSYIIECDSLLSEVTIEYSKYNEELNILKLIDIYDKMTSSYEELLTKREKIDEIFKNIDESELYKRLYDELSKQYNTIKLEQRDIETYEKLKEERETMNKILYDIDEENNSKEFKLVLSELIRNEDRIKEERVRLAKRNEYNERQKRIAEEQKIEAARVRRQKLIEEARLKEQLASTERLKKLQDETVISPINEEEKEEVKKPIPNPLKNKTFDNLDLDNDFDTDELFGKTKIVPNKVDNLVKKEPIIEESKEEVPLWESPVEPKKEIREEPIRKEIPDRVSDLPRVSDFVPKEAPKEIPKEEVKDLFKEEDNKVELNIEDKKEEKSKKSGSIYDLLENNKNIIWKSTGTSDNINKSTIPVIGNNNLKPEILGSSKVDDLAFPDMNKKEGEILWKETM
jgi:hypothetical protein